MPIVSGLGSGPRLTGVGRKGDDVAHSGDSGQFTRLLFGDTLWLRWASDGGA